MDYFKLARYLIAEAICRQHHGFYVAVPLRTANINSVVSRCLKAPEKDKEVALFWSRLQQRDFEGIPGVPEADDVDITRNNIEDNFAAFNFTQASDIAHYEKLLKKKAST